MNYQKISRLDIANGPGIRVVFWVSGCEHHCPGCHNACTWDPASGKPFTAEAMNTLMEALGNPHVNGLTLSGGDPLAPYNRKGIYEIVREARRLYPEKDIWIYTGYLYEDMMAKEDARAILKLCDVCVDGEFILAQKQVNLIWKGSANQRVIDIQKSSPGNVVLFEG